MKRDEADWLETLGLLVIEWAHVEERFTFNDSGPASPDIRAAARASGTSEKQLRWSRQIRNQAVHQPSDQPSLDQLDEAVGILEYFWRALDGNEPQPVAPTQRGLKTTSTTGVDPPTTYPNPRGDNPWDNDAVHWLLTKEEVTASFSRGTLMECLRCQPAKVAQQPHRVEEAARLARKFGVIQRQEVDEKLGKRVVRLYRTDADRPRYPGDPPSKAGVS